MSGTGEIDASGPLLHKCEPRSHLSFDFCKLSLVNNEGFSSSNHGLITSRKFGYFLSPPPLHSHSSKLFQVPLEKAYGDSHGI